jgi:hypothetical protein
MTFAACLEARDERERERETPSLRFPDQSSHSTGLARARGRVLPDDETTVLRGRDEKSGPAVVVHFMLVAHNGPPRRPVWHCLLLLSPSVRESYGARTWRHTRTRLRAWPVRRRTTRRGNVVDCRQTGLLRGEGARMPLEGGTQTTGEPLSPSSTLNSESRRKRARSQRRKACMSASEGNTTVP